MLFFFFLLSTTRPTHPIQPFFLRPPGFSPAFFSLKFDVMIRSIQRGFWRTSFLAFILNFFLHHHSITHFFSFFSSKRKERLIHSPRKKFMAFRSHQQHHPLFHPHTLRQNSVFVQTCSVLFFSSLSSSCPCSLSQRKAPSSFSSFHLLVFNFLSSI